MAVIDTGVARVPDLAGQLLPGTDLVSSGGDGTADGHGHGTHVAGIVAAVANNGIGVAGLAPQAKILPIRALDDNGVGYDSAITSAIIYAADHGADIVNMSLGGSAGSSAEAAAVAYARGKDVLVVAAAGNGRASGNLTSYPAAFPGVLAVAASDPTDEIASFSNTGSYVGVAAPGVMVLSTYRDGGAVYMSGTSMASPYAAAVAALVRSAAPALPATGVAAAMTSTATDVGPTGRDDESGAGIVDPVAALQKVTAPVAAVPTPTTPTPTPHADADPDSHADPDADADPARRPPRRSPPSPPPGSCAPPPPPSPTGRASRSARSLSPARPAPRSRAPASTGAPAPPPVAATPAAASSPTGPARPRSPIQPTAGTLVFARFAGTTTTKASTSATVRDHRPPQGHGHEHPRRPARHRHPRRRHADHGGHLDRPRLAHPHHPRRRCPRGRRGEPPGPGE